MSSNAPMCMYWLSCSRPHRKQWLVVRGLSCSRERLKVITQISEHNGFHGDFRHNFPQNDALLHYLHLPLFYERLHAKLIAWIVPIPLAVRRFSLFFVHLRRFQACKSGCLYNVVSSMIRGWENVLDPKICWRMNTSRVDYFHERLPKGFDFYVIIRN